MKKVTLIFLSMVFCLTSYADDNQDGFSSYRSAGERIYECNHHNMELKNNYDTALADYNNKLESYGTDTKNYKQQLVKYNKDLKKYQKENALADKIKNKIRKNMKKMCLQGQFRDIPPIACMDSVVEAYAAIYVYPRAEEQYHISLDVTEPEKPTLPVAPTKPEPIQLDDCSTIESE